MRAEFARYTGHEGLVVPHFFQPEWAGGLDYVTGSNTHKGATSWFVMNFWWDYLYSGDRVFLREVTYPLLRMAADFFTGYLVKESDGRYHLVDSNSPEQDGTNKDNTFDWSLLRFLYRASIQASEILGVDAELRPLWRERLDNLYALPGDQKTVWECSTVAHPYRCHPVVMFMLHPTNALDFGTPEYERARRTMEPVTRLFGFRYEDRHAPIPAFEGGVEPNGFSSGILTTNAARLGDREMYRRFLYGLIVRFHMKQNGLRALIDTRQSDDISRSSLVEAANAHTVAITETLVQSWRDHVRLFGCIEKKGRYRFSGLRGAPGVVLEAEIVDGTVRHLKAKCVASGPVKLVWPGGSRAIDCTPGVTHTLVGDAASRIALAPVAPAGQRHAPRRIAIDTVENMVEPLVHYPENLPFAQVVEDDYLYLGRPAKFAAPRTPPDAGRIAAARLQREMAGPPARGTLVRFRPSRTRGALATRPALRRFHERRGPYGRREPGACGHAGGACHRRAARRARRGARFEARSRESAPAPSQMSGTIGIERGAKRIRRD